MANTLYDSFLNPVKFHQLDNVQIPNYVSRFMDDWAFRRTIQPWQQDICFYQPWGQSDSIRLQYTANFGPFVLRMYNYLGQLVLTQSFNDVMQDELRPTYYIKQIAVSLAGFDPGKYFFVRDTGGVLTYSEPFEILDAEDSGIMLTNQNPTLYIEYSHYESYQGVKFFTPFAPSIRVPAVLRYKSPGAKDNVYEDQLLNMTLVNSVPFRIFDFTLGGNYGVPPYFIDKIARIFGCSSLSIDGRLYTKNEGAQFEPALLENYPSAGYSIELREKLNRDSIITENDVIIEGIAAAAIIMDNKGFGIDGGDTDYTEILYLQ